jgi:hypothetical protein
MEPGFDNMNLSCRINVQAELSFQDFVKSVARCATGVSHMNEVQSKTLDISVHKNDVFDPSKSRTGKDRWLYFKYTLEIDPSARVSPGDYIAAIGSLLKELWSSRMDAVAACDFEDRLPRNVRRLKWAWNPQHHGEVAGATWMNGRADIMIPPTADPVASLDACARIVRRYWIQARFEDPATATKYSYQDIPFGRVEELLAYRNSQAEAAWDADNPDVPVNSMLHLMRFPQCITAVMDDAKAADMESMLASMGASLRKLDAPNPYGEAA